MGSDMYEVVEEAKESVVKIHLPDQEKGYFVRDDVNLGVGAISIGIVNADVWVSVMVALDKSFGPVDNKICVDPSFSG